MIRFLVQGEIMFRKHCKVYILILFEKMNECSQTFYTDVKFDPDSSIVIEGARAKISYFFLILQEKQNYVSNQC